MLCPVFGDVRVCVYSGRDVLTMLCGLEFMFRCVCVCVLCLCMGERMLVCVCV